MTPVVVQYPVNPGPEFDAFIDVLLMKMYRFKDDDRRTARSSKFPAEEAGKGPGAEQGAWSRRPPRHDEALMELYFDKGTLTQDEHPLGPEDRRTRQRDGDARSSARSGKRDIGTKRLMEFIINVAPGPLKAPAFLYDRRARRSRPTRRLRPWLFVFKSQIEQHIGEMTYFRVIRGKITEGMELVNTRTGNKEKLSQLFAVAGKNRVKVTELDGRRHRLHGQTARAPRTNHTLSARRGADIRIEPIVFPEPRYRAAVKRSRTRRRREAGQAAEPTPTSRTRRFWSNTPRSSSRRSCRDRANIT